MFDTLGELDDATRRALLDPELDDDVRRDFYRAWEGETEISQEDLGRSIQRYRALESDSARSQFQHLLADSELRGSWVRSVGHADTDLEGAHRALTRVEDIENDQISQFHPATEANAEFVERQRAEGNSDPQPPHRDSSVVIDLDAEGTPTYYRAFDSNNPNSNMIGAWTTDQGTLASADGYGDLNELLAAPDGISYDSLARVEVPDGTRLRMSTVAANFGDPGGGTQIRLVERVSENRWGETSLSEVRD